MSPRDRHQVLWMPANQTKSILKKSKVAHSSSQQLVLLPSPSDFTPRAEQVARQSVIGLKRSQRSRRPSAHKIESDEYQASSRGSSRPPTPSQLEKNPTPRKRSHGKRGDRPGRIIQPDTPTRSTGDNGSPEPYPVPGSQLGDSLLAGHGPTGDGLEPTNNSEAIRQASEFLGVDASRLHPRTLQKVLAEIANNAEATQASAMDLEGGSAPAILQPARQVVLEGGQQTNATTATGITKPPHDPVVRTASMHVSQLPRASHLEIPVDEDTATESETEPESVELGPGDSVSQRLPVVPLPRRSPPAFIPRPSYLPHNPDSADRITMDLDIEAIDELDKSCLDSTSGSDTETTRASKRLRMLRPPSTRSIQSRLSRKAFSMRNLGALPASRQSRSRSVASATQAPHATCAPTATAIAQMPVATLTEARQSTMEPVSLLALAPASAPPPPPTSDTNAVLAWATEIAKQVASGGAGTGCTNGQPEPAFGLLAQVLEDLRGRIAPSISTSAIIERRANTQQSPRSPNDLRLLEDNSEALEAEAAHVLDQHIPTRRKPSLSDFPGLPHRIASLAIPEMLAEAFTQGPYETFGTLCDLAGKVFARVWLRELPKRKLWNAPALLEGVMVHRISWFRGESKVRIREKIPLVYGFKNPPRTSEDLKFNRRLVKKLLPNTFHCRNLISDVDQYEHPALEQCIAAAFFSGPDSIGMAYHSKFQPVPLPAVSTTLTIMQHCIREWKTGRFVKIDLNANKQLNVYKAHLKGLLEYAKPAPKRLRDFQREWFWYGVDYAGVPMEDDPPSQPITQADRVRPDTPDPDTRSESGRPPAAKGNKRAAV